MINITLVTLLKIDELEKYGCYSFVILKIHRIIMKYSVHIAVSNVFL